MATAAHLYAGFLGGLASSVTLQPLDLLKTRVQQGSAGLVSVLGDVKSVRDAWRGTLPSALRTSIGASLYLTLLNRIRQMRAQEPDAPHRASSALPRLSAMNNVATGAFARAAVGFVMMPITVVKVRFESSLFRYSSMLDAVRDIVRGPTGWRGLFAGYIATASRDAPYAGLYMLFYESGKDALQVSWLPGAAANTLAAVGAAASATTVTAPFDTIKTRVQISRTPISFLTAFSQIVAEKRGVRALFDGLGLRLTRKALSAGISWCIYEEVVRRMSQPARLSH